MLDLSSEKLLDLLEDHPIVNEVSELSFSIEVLELSFVCLIEHCSFHGTLSRKLELNVPVYLIEEHWKGPEDRRLQKS